MEIWIDPCEGRLSGARRDILQGWKSIADHVSRDIRTVKRWEKRRGFPVRRMPGDQRANVYVLVAELDQWLAGAGANAPEIDTPESHISESKRFRPDPSEFPAPEGDSSHTVGSLTARVNEVVSVPHYTQSAAAPDQFPALDRLPAPQASVYLPNAPARRGHLVALGLAVLAVLSLFVSIAVHRVRVGAASKSQSRAVAKLTSEAQFHSQKPEVNELYVRGLYLYEQRTPESLDHALSFFRSAVAADPGYAPAYAGIANTFNLLREYTTMPSSEAYPQAEAAADRAIALDPRLPEAHAALGFVKFFWDWKAEEAEREFQTALELDPDSALAHHWYGSMLMHQGRFDAALQQLDLAQHLQPTSNAILGTRAFALGLSGHRNEAADMLQEMGAEDARSPSPHAILAYLSLAKPRDLARFLDESRRFAEVRHDREQLRVNVIAEAAFRSSGEDSMWRAILHDEAQNHPAPGDRTYLMVRAEAALGMNDEAFHDLDQVVSRHEDAVTGMAIDPALESLHKDARFPALLSSVGLAASR